MQLFSVGAKGSALPIALNWYAEEMSPRARNVDLPAGVEVRLE
jgi:hypothetical protein